MIFNVGTYICVIYRWIRLPTWNLLKLEFERAILSVNKICGEQKQFVLFILFSEQQ